MVEWTIHCRIGQPELGEPELKEQTTKLIEASAVLNVSTDVATRVLITRCLGYARLKGSVSEFTPLKASIVSGRYAHLKGSVSNGGRAVKGNIRKRTRLSGG
jgi:hypothetical protein